MIKSSEIKKAALNKLNWKNSFLVSTMFVLANLALSYALEFGINLTINTPILNFAVNMIYLALFLPLSFGFISVMSKSYKSEKVYATTIFNDAILNFTKSISIFLRTLWKMLLPSIIIIAAIIGILFLTVQNLPITTANLTGYTLYIILLYSVALIGILLAALPYILSSYILADNQTMKSKEILEQSAILMENKKCDFVKLIMSFLGWFLLLATITVIANMAIGTIVGSLIYWTGMILLMPYLVTSIKVFYEECQE